MMSSSCKSSVHCIDSHVPVRATCVNLYKWPESDAEFVRLVSRGREAGMLTSATTNNNKEGAHNSTENRPAVVDSYSCRQMYLRSYTFSRKESAREKTKKCLVRVKERASMLACLWMSKRERRPRKKKKKKICGCSVNIGEMRRMYSAAFTSVFQRVMSCSRSIP